MEEERHAIASGNPLGNRYIVENFEGGSLLKQTNGKLLSWWNLANENLT